MKAQFQHFKEEMIAIGQLLWRKDLASGLNGNISRRIDKDTILLTAHGTCLGNLEEKDILAVNVGAVREPPLHDHGNVSTEKLLHTEIYKNFPDAQAVIHTHTTYTNAYFLANETFVPRIFEAKFYLGEIRGIPQATPAVTDAGPVVEGFKKNNIVVLRNHGVAAKGEKLFDCFLLIQALEEAVKTDAISRLYSHQSPVTSHQIAGDRGLETGGKKYKLFSQEQINDIVKLVNADAQMKDLGENTKMTMDLAVKLNETGQTYSFRFENGRIANVSHDENAEFLITAPENVWRAVFNREIDPFVATTQKKMNLRGDFAKISKWYAPCSRVFELWQQVPVE
ncbi:MAG: class II aldolase/adducin family protein [Candidatus Omnitrophica bacterium]|nr:class II aldolase/adducin family protein [Candidatus Omnitrophota bacterium]